MNDEKAIGTLGALAQIDRLAAFRLLVKAGPAGLPSGNVAAELNLAPTNMSFHLAALERSGLVTAQRDGRRIVYRANFQRMRSLLAFLTEDCCGNDPAICNFSNTCRPDGREPGDTNQC